MPHCVCTCHHIVVRKIKPSRPFPPKSVFHWPRPGRPFLGVRLASSNCPCFAIPTRTGFRQEEAMWRWFLGLAALPSAMVAIAHKFLPESPRFLHVTGRHDEAMQVRLTCDDWFASDRINVIGSLLIPYATETACAVGWRR